LLRLLLNALHSVAVIIRLIANINFKLKIFYILLYASIFSTICFPTAAGFIKYNLIKKDKIYFLFFIFFLFSALVESVLFIMSLWRVNNVFLINLFFLFEFLIISFLILQWIPYPVFKKILLVAMCVVFIFCSLRLLFYNLFTELDTVSSAFENIVLIVISGFLLYSVTSDTSIPLTQNPKFWIGGAVFTYFTVDIVVFCTDNLLTDTSISIRQAAWTINSILTIISNIFYSIGILCLRPKKI
jgi:hypothetical protein